jgi:hypothetical protein
VEKHQTWSVTPVIAHGDSNAAHQHPPVRSRSCSVSGHAT